jgi:RNA polymerase sigma factor (sigma-70 family)
MRLTPAQQRLAADNAAWAGYVVLHKLHIKKCYLEDAVQSGMVGLCRATTTYDATLGAFRYYSTLPITSDALAYVRAEMRRPHVRLTDAVLLRAGTHEEPSPFDVDEKRAKVNFAMDLLGPRQRFVISRMYGLDGLPSETAASLGRKMSLTRSAVSLIHTQALSAMRPL